MTVNIYTLVGQPDSSLNRKVNLMATVCLAYGVPCYDSKCDPFPSSLPL